MTPRGKLNLALAGAFLLSLGLNGWLVRDPARPNAEILPEMVRTPRYNAFAPNVNFPDGKTLQQPVAGTIPRGYLPLRFSASEADAVRAGEELRNPFSTDDPAARTRGAQVFAAFCFPCHGAGGRGDGPVALRGFPAPPSLLADQAVRLKDGRMFHILTYGQKNMPAYASQISEPDRWRVIVFVRTLQQEAARAASGAQR